MNSPLEPNVRGTKVERVRGVLASSAEKASAHGIASNPALRIAFGIAPSGGPENGQWLAMGSGNRSHESANSAPTTSVLAAAAINPIHLRGLCFICPPTTRPAHGD